MKKKILIFFGLVVLITMAILFLKFNNINKLGANLLSYQEGNIKLNIYNVLEEDNNIKMHYKDINKIEINVDLNKYLDDEKILKIELKEGLEYSSLPVLTITDNSYQTEISKNNTLYNAINFIDLNNIITEDNSINITNSAFSNSAYGEVNYHIKKGVENIKISMNISSDIFRYYGEHIIENAISIDLICNGKLENSLTKNVKLYNQKSDNNDIYISSTMGESYYYNKTIKASTNNNIEYGNYRFIYNEFQEGNLKMDGLPMFDRIIYELYHPVGTNFEALIDNTGAVVPGINRYNISDITVEELCKSLPSGINVIVDESQNKVFVITNDNSFDQKRISVKYRVKTIDEINSLYGNTLIKAEDTIETDIPSTGVLHITFYDGTTRDISISGGDFKPQIWYPYDIPNIMEFNKSYIDENINNAYDDANDSTFIFGPYFVFQNLSPSEKTNQVLEYQIDENYQVIGVSFPRELNKSSVSNIKYQIYGTCTKCGVPDRDGWYSYSGVISDFRFTKNNIGDLSNSYYFKAVKGTVSRYSEGFDTVGAAPKGEKNGVLYGNLKSNVNQADVTLNIYGESNPDIKKTLTKKVYKNIDKLTLSGSYSSEINYFDKSTVLTGEDFEYSYNIKIIKYPYGSRMYMDDVYIYVREPKGLKINKIKLNHIKNNLESIIIDGENLVEGVEISKKERENDTIYTIKTKRSIGYGLSENEVLENITSYFDLKVSYHVKEDSNLTSVNDEELVTWGNPDYEFISTMDDVYDINNNGITKEKIPKILYKYITIQKANSFVAATYVEKDGKVFDSYNESNKDTIIDLDYKDTFNYNVKLINNTDKAAKYSILIPIPKKGLDFGKKYQEEEFAWDISLIRKISENEDFNIFYNTSKDINNMNFVPYSKELNLEDVNMIKLSSKKEVPIGKEYLFTISLGLNSKPSDNKKINIWNPVSYIEATDVTGEFDGTKIAINMNYKKVSGLVYLDINKNKTYDKNIDIPGVSDLKLELYKKVDDSYEKVSDKNIDILTGEFIIEDAKFLKNNIFALKLTSELFIGNSDFLKENWIYDIDFTSNNSYYYEIGYITDEFAPSIKTEDAYIYVGDKIEFEKYIIEAYDYKKEKIEFEFGENGNTKYSSDIPNNNGIATKAGIYYATYDVTDKYGNKGSSLIKIYVKEKAIATTSTSKKDVIVPPSTLDDIAKYIIIGMLSLVGIVISIILYKKIKTNK